jgi:DnaJ-class molecular chaperone
MPRLKSNKPKRNIWTDTTSPYGTYQGDTGNPDQWKNFFKQATYSREKANGILQLTLESPYTILGLECYASQEQIKTAFRKLAIIHHPDKGGNRNKFEQIMAAYSILTIKETT